MMPLAQWAASHDRRHPRTHRASRPQRPGPEVGVVAAPRGRRPRVGRAVAVPAAAAALAAAIVVLPL